MSEYTSEDARRDYAATCTRADSPGVRCPKHAYITDLEDQLAIIGGERQRADDEAERADRAEARIEKALAMLRSGRVTRTLAILRGEDR